MMAQKGVESILLQILKNDRGILLLTAMIFLAFCTNILLTAGVAYDSHYRAYNALKIAAIDQTKEVLYSIDQEKNDESAEIIEEHKK